MKGTYFSDIFYPGKIERAIAFSSHMHLAWFKYTTVQSVYTADYTALYSYLVPVWCISFVNQSQKSFEYSAMLWLVQQMTEDGGVGELPFVDTFLS